MEFKTVLSQFIYRIDSKPGGGFIATCKDSAAPAIEGATREEVQQKIQQTVTSKVAEQFPALEDALASRGIKLHYHVESKPGGGFIIHHDDAAHDSAHDSSDHVAGFIESKILSTLLDRLPAEHHQQITNKLNAGGLDIEINRNINVITKSGSTVTLPAYDSTSGVPHFSPPLGEVGTSAAQIQPSDSTNQLSIRGDINSPVKYEKSRGLFRFLIALAILALLAFFFLLRR
jgi:hypothetical protein